MLSNRARNTPIQRYHVVVESGQGVVLDNWTAGNPVVWRGGFAEACEVAARAEGGVLPYGALAVEQRVPLQLVGRVAK